MDVSEYPTDALFLDEVVTETLPSIPPKFRRSILDAQEAISSPVDSTVDQIEALQRGLNDWKAQEPKSKIFEELANFLIEMRANTEALESIVNKILKRHMDSAPRHSIPSQRTLSISIDL